MNKYEESVNFFKRLVHRVPLKSADDKFCKQYDENIDCINELVDKATPKKPTYVADGYSDGELVYDTWVCPNCDEDYEFDYHDYDYCPKCGQAIDWSEEE